MNLKELIANNIALCKVIYADYIKPEKRILWADEQIKCLYIKSKVWEYENEWRLITTKENLYKNHKLLKGFSIKSITFGLKTQKKDIDTITQLLPNCKFYIMKQEDKYEKPFSIIRTEYDNDFYYRFKDSMDFIRCWEPESLKEQLEYQEKRKIKND